MVARRLTVPAAWRAVVPAVIGTAIGALIGALIGAVIGAAPALAEPTHAIAMHGQPKHGAGFAQFDYVNPDAPKGGRLVLGVVGSFDSLNPFVIKGVPAAGMNLVHERLLKRGRDEPFTLYGLIAESVEVPPDRSWVAFRLRPQARFHDGTPITADDVIFSWRTLAKQGRPNHRLFYRMVERAEKTGPRAVKFVFKVDPKANKSEVRKAIETLFDVKVKRVNICNMPGKMRRFLGRPGRSTPWKKAIVTLHEGQTIDLV